MEIYEYTGPVMWISTGDFSGVTLKEGDKVGAEVNINIATIYKIYNETGTTVLNDAKVDVAAKYLKDADDTDDTDSHEVGGTHYKSSIEPWDFIYANHIPFDEANCIKYLCRHRKKNGAEDIRKVISYCKHILKTQYGEDE